MRRHEPCAMFAEPLAAGERIDREMVLLAHLRERIASLSPEQCANEADAYEEVAAGNALLALTQEGRTRQALIWLSGSYAMRAQVYAAAARAI